jgi:hypothetical protein
VRAPAELSEMQAFLGAAFRRQRPIVEDAEVAAAAGAYVAGNERLTPAEQADIYRQQFWLRHFAALAEDYLGLAALLGEDAFDDFVTAFLTAVPPRHPSLRDLGDGIVAFAEGYAGFAPSLRAAALEMVRYEHAIVEVFDAAEPPLLDGAKLAALPEDAWERATIVLHPRLYRWRLAHPVHSFRLAAKAAADAGEEAPPFPAPREVRLALYRRELTVSYEELPAEAYDLLEALAGGEALVPACNRIAAQLGEAEGEALGASIGPWFQQWTAWRWIVDVVL